MLLAHELFDAASWAAEAPGTSGLDVLSRVLGRLSAWRPYKRMAREPNRLTTDDVGGQRHGAYVSDAAFSDPWRRLRNQLGNVLEMKSDAQRACCCRDQRESCAGAFGHDTHSKHADRWRE